MTSPAERWLEAGTTHSRTMASVEDRVERMRMLATAPLFSLWREVRMELEEAATEIEQLRRRVKELEDAGA